MNQTKICVDLFFFEYESGRGYFFDDAQDRYSVIYGSREQAENQLDNGPVAWHPVGHVPFYVR